MAVVADFDPATPSIARVYDYLLDGKDNFAVDREAAERLKAAAPLTVEVTRENRQFLARAVTWAANQGITQFIDLGCGMPTVPNTHETARAIFPGVRVVYLDNDAPVTRSHWPDRSASRSSAWSAVRLLSGMVDASTGVTLRGAGATASMSRTTCSA